MMMMMMLGLLGMRTKDVKICIYKKGKLRKKRNMFFLKKKAAAAATKHFKEPKYFFSFKKRSCCCSTPFVSVFLSVREILLKVLNLLYSSALSTPVHELIVHKSLSQKEIKGRLSKPNNLTLDYRVLLKLYAASIRSRPPFLFSFILIASPSLFLNNNKSSSLCVCVAQSIDRLFRIFSSHKEKQKTVAEFYQK